VRLHQERRAARAKRFTFTVDGRRQTSLISYYQNLGGVHRDAAYVAVHGPPPSQKATDFRPEDVVGVELEILLGYIALFSAIIIYENSSNHKTREK
jgi:hypothetical protein